MSGVTSQKLKSVRQVNRKDFSARDDLLVLIQKHDPCELLCFDNYDKQIARYLTLLPSL